VYSHNGFYAKNSATDLTLLRSFTKIEENEILGKQENSVRHLTPHFLTGGKIWQ
jgi:hypothetical protein